VSSWLSEGKQANGKADQRRIIGFASPLDSIRRLIQRVVIPACAHGAHVLWRTRLPVRSRVEVEVGKSGHDYTNCPIVSSIKMNIELVADHYLKIGIWAFDQQIRLAELENLLA
jgi:hypothetical protein